MLPRLRSLTKRLKKSEAGSRLVGQSRRWVKSTRRLLDELAEAGRSLRAPAAAAPLVLEGGKANGANGKSGSAAPALSDHVAMLVDKRLKRLLESADFTSAEDPVEAVHDLRVASRRIRAFLEVFVPLLDEDISRSARKPVRRVTRSAGALRDWDVQKALLEKRLAAAELDSERAALEHVLEHVERERARAEKATTKKLKKLDGDGVRHAVCAALGEAVAGLPTAGVDTAQFAWTTLTSLAAAARYDAAGDRGTRAERMHATRVDLKRLRYALELFEPVLRPSYRELYTSVVELQDLLGSHHDLVVLGERIRGHRADLEKHGRETLRAGLASVENRIAAERDGLEQRFAVDGFDEARFLARVRDALSARKFDVSDSSPPADAHSAPLTPT
jgi:CHAD domain-containing protein